MRAKKPKRAPKPDTSRRAPRGAGAPADHVAVGAITGARGVRGQVRIKPFTSVPEDVTAYGPVVTADGRQFRVRIEGLTKGAVIAAIDGIGTRNAAEALKGTSLYVPRAALPEPEENEFYHADLIGLEAVRPNGDAFGRVTAVHDFGAGDLLEIARAAKERTVLVPFTREAVPEIDIKAGRLVCDPPEGLLEIRPSDEKKERAS